MAQRHSPVSWVHDRKMPADTADADGKLAVPVGGEMDDLEEKQIR